MSARRLIPAVLVALACGGAAPSAGAAVGDVGVADQGSWLGQTGRVLRVGSGGGEAALLASGSPLSNPWAVAVAGTGALIVVDEDAEAVFSVAPSGAVSTVVTDNGLLDPVGIALAPGGIAYISDRDREAVLRLDLVTGAMAVVARLDDPAGLAVDKAGKLLVADGRAVRRIDPGTGAITTFAEGLPIDEPRDVAVAQDGTAYVVGDRQVVRVNAATGAKSVFAAGAPFADPRAIDIEPDGDLVVADRSAGDGAVIHVDLESGVKTVLSSGGAFRVPTGLAVVGGAGFDASDGGNGTGSGPGGPVDPPDPIDPGDPGGPGVPGTPGGPGAPGGTAVGPGIAGITVTLPDGRVVTLPPGVTRATSGILGVDFAAPAFLARPRLHPTSFRAARRGRAFVAVQTGTTIAYKLNEPARVSITVQRNRQLSRFCRRKLARQSRHRTGTRCRLWISVKGRFSKASLAGASSVRFRGRLKGKALKPGRYRFVIRATDPAGNVSPRRRPVFHIVR